MATESTHDAIYGLAKKRLEYYEELAARIIAQQAGNPSASLPIGQAGNPAAAGGSGGVVSGAIFSGLDTSTEGAIELLWPTEQAKPTLECPKVLLKWLKTTIKTIKHG